jgi:ABC-type transport system substrate-binding protein
VTWFSGTEPNHLDGIAQGQSQLNTFNGMAYASLVANETGYKEPSSFTSVVPNLAESWEFSPDGLTLTFKLRKGTKWPNRPPVNNRVFDSSDVVANWERYITLKGNNAAANANAINPSAPIVSVEAPDADTVVYNLIEPSAYIMQRLARMVTGEAGTIQPREANEGTFDPRTDQIGNGGFILDKWEPSVGLTYKRNPDYWNKDEPRIETLDVKIIPEYATQLAAFQAGDLLIMPVRSGDVLSVKKQTPEVNLYQALVSSNAVGVTVGFGWLPWGSHAKSPWVDERVRQAWSMSYHRDDYIEAFNDVSKFEAEGLPMETYWFSSMGHINNVHLDPRDSAFGENAKYFENNPDEAKALLSAAGFADGLDVPVYFVNSGQFGEIGLEEELVVQNFAAEVGFRSQPVGIDYNTEYLTKFVTSRGQHDGILFRRGAISSPDATDLYLWRYYSKSGATSGAVLGDIGSGDGAGDAEVDAFIDKAKGAKDPESYVAILHDLQRHLGKTQYAVPRPGIASAFQPAWPGLANYSVFQNDSRGGTDANNGNWFYATWADQTKAPFA